MSLAAIKLPLLLKAIVLEKCLTPAVRIIDILRTSRQVEVSQSFTTESPHDAISSPQPGTKQIGFRSVKK
jgi:hypothetical protein